MLTFYSSKKHNFNTFTISFENSKRSSLLLQMWRQGQIDAPNRHNTSLFFILRRPLNQQINRFKAEDFGMTFHREARLPPSTPNRIFLINLLGRQLYFKL